MNVGGAKPLLRPRSLFYRLVKAACIESDLEGNNHVDRS
jgi:hypothetical protein